MSARRRIIIALGLTIAAGIWYLLYWIVSDLEPRYRSSVEESLVDVANILAAIAETQTKGGQIDTADLNLAFAHAYDRPMQARIYEVIKNRVDMRAYVTDAAGKVLFDSTGLHTGEDYSEWHDVMLTLQGQYGARTTRDDPADPRTSVLYVGAPIYADGKIIGVVSVGEPTSGLYQFITLAKKRIIDGSLLALLLITLAALLIAFLITRPIGLLLDYFRLLRESPNVSLPRLGRGAIGIIGRTFDEMRDALEGRGYVEKYVQALTHEIKSPLSAVRGAAELMREEMPAEQRAKFLKNILVESNRIQVIVDKLLELSALEKRSGLSEPKRVDLSTLFSELAESFAPALVASGVILQSSCEPELAVRGDPFLVRQALTNLVQNAIDFSPAGGTIKLCGMRRGSRVEIEILDQGPGIPEFAADKIYDRFYSLRRPGTGRKSTGLGLSFVREIAELHHGEVRVASMKTGGTCAKLLLHCA
ncbi:MAG: two-component system sensor histidine kinase CreC [Oligoflexia bacterium]|nr:two-component system sensor histidine kinase CreC [Oligoflexia bacterium]